MRSPAGPTCARACIVPLVLLSACAASSVPDAGSPDSGPRDSGPDVLWVPADGGLGNHSLSVIDMPGILFIALDGDRMLFTSADGVFSLDRATGMATQLVGRSSPFDEPIEVVSDDGGVYWTAEDLTLYRLDRQTRVVTQVDSANPSTAALVLSNSLVFLGDYRGVTVHPTDGGPIVTTIDMGGEAYGLTVSGAEGYATVLPGNFGFDADILHFDMTGDAGLLVSEQREAQNATFDDQFVYWGTADVGGDGGALMRAPRGGGQPAEVLHLPLPVLAVTDVGGVVYFATWPGQPVQPGEQGLYRYDSSSGSTVQLATGLQWVLDILVAPEGVYWSENNRRIGRIVPKP